MRAERHGRLFSLARHARIALLAAACLIGSAGIASAQVPSGLVGTTTWQGTITQTPPAPGFTSGVWNVTEVRVTTLGGSSTVNGTIRSSSQPQYFINYTSGGMISGGVYTYTGSAHADNLPFGDTPCSVGGTESISSTSISFSGSGGGSGSCGTTTAVLQLYNVTGATQGNPQQPCPLCPKMSENLPANPSNFLASLPGNGDQTAGAGIGKVGDPIDVATGNVLETVNDYATAGPNVLALNRYYNSQPPVSTYATTLGPQWRTSFDRYLNIAPSYLVGYVSTGATSNLIAERPDGSQMIFFQTGSVYTASDSSDDATLTISGSTYTLTLHDDTVETYTATGGKGVLSSITYRGGYTETLAYNGSGQLSTVTDSYGRALTFTYTGGLLTQVTTPDSLVLTYGYTSGLLTSVSYNTSPVTSQTYNYTNTSFPNALTSVTDENSNTYRSWTYDSYGRGLTSQLGTGANADITTIVYNDSTDGSRTVTNALGLQEKYTFLNYGAVPRPLEVVRVSGGASLVPAYDSNSFVASVTDWNGNITTYTNDAHGDPTTIVEATGKPIARTTTITYDTTRVHQPKTVVTPLLTTGFTYDANGNLLTKTETDTTSQVVPYSTNGQTRTWTLTWSNFLPASITPPKGSGFGTAITFDATGALTAVTDALSQAWNITSHTGGGRPLIMVDPNSVTTTLTYSPRNWPLTKTVTTSAGNLTTTNLFDAAGNLTKVTQPDGSYFTATYDTAHRRTQMADSFGNSMNYTLDAAGDRTASNIKNPSGTVTRGHTATFDTLRRQITDVNGTSWSTGLGYDANGNLNAYVPPSSDFNYIFDGLNRRLTESVYPYGNNTLTYDAHDRPLTVTSRNSSVTSYVYDGFGDVIQETSPDRGTTVYHYDADANLTSKVDALSITTNFTYDALDRVLTTSYPADTSENVAYTYDQTGTGFAFGIGRLTSLTDMAGSLTRTYDERGNLITEKRVNGTTVLTTTYGYDTASRIATITYPSGALVTYVRDAMGRVTSVTDKPSGASSATTLASSATYEPLGPWLSFTYGNGIAETVTRDADYALLTLKDIGTATVQSITYAYAQEDQPTAYTDNVTPSNNLTMSYDALYRLLNCCGLNEQFDNNGNRTNYNGITTTYTYTPNSNRLATIVHAGTTTTVTTNANGNITGFSPAYGAMAVTGLSYNNANRLISVSGSSGTLGSYVYDAFGNRFSKTVGTSTTLYQYSPGMTLLEETTGGTATDYVYLNGRPIAMLTGTTFTYLHGDNLGRPQKATSASQAVVWSASYFPFGENVNTSGSFVMNLRFVGQYYDAETGFSHNGFRDYVPALGRYLETDPVGIYDGAPTSGMNTYLYVGARPMSLMDPWGLDGFLVNRPNSVAIGNGGYLGHSAVIVGDPTFGYVFYSKNGEDPNGNDFNETQMFSNNNDLQSFLDENGYSNVLDISSSVGEDIAMLEYAEQHLKDKYGKYNNCSTFAYNVLGAGGIQIPNPLLFLPTVPNLQFAIAQDMHNAGYGFTYFGSSIEMLRLYLAPLY